MSWVGNQLLPAIVTVMGEEQPTTAEGLANLLDSYGYNREAAYVRQLDVGGFKTLIEWAEAMRSPSSLR